MEQSQEFRKELLSGCDILYSFAVSLTRNPFDAEDLVQETFAKGLEKHHQFRYGSNLQAWLRTIMYHLFLDQQKKDKSRKYVVDDYDAYLQQSLPPPQEYALELQDVSKLMNALPEEQRETVLLSAEGYSYKEISSLLQCEMGTAKSRLNRGRTALLAAYG